MSKKSDQVTHLLDLVQLPQGVPEPPKSGTLLEQGMVLALLEHVPASRAEAAVYALRKAYVDWNEARVAQAQELAGHLAGRGGKSAEKSEKGGGDKSSNERNSKAAKHIPVANAVRNYLQEVFQRTHGLDLEFLRTDPAAAAKIVTALPMLGNYLGSVLLWLASGGEQPVTTSVMRVLDRLRLLSRTSSVKKAREAMGPLVPSDQELRFAAGFGYVADRWCDARKPICWECVLVEECATGKKVAKDWKLQQERQAVHRARDEAKRAAQEKKDAARREREAERARKHDEAARLKAERERERKAKREADAKKKAPVAAAKDARPSGKSPAPAKKSSGKPAAAKQPAAMPATDAKAAAKSASKPSGKKSEAKVSSTHSDAKKADPKKAESKKPESKKPDAKRTEPKPAEARAAEAASRNARKKGETPAKSGKRTTSSKSAGDLPPAKPAVAKAAGAKSVSKSGSRKGDSAKSNPPSRSSQRKP